MVICNSQGLVIASLSQQFLQSFQAVEIEAIVASCALEFGLEIEIAQAILEGDSMVIMNALEDDELSLATLLF